MNQDHKGRKAPFTAPQLLVYGRARDITRAVGNKGELDGGAGNTSKTQP
jgi:hypothetical protein